MEDKEDRREKGSRKIPLLSVLSVVLVGLLAIWIVEKIRSQRATGEIARRLLCGTRIHALGKALRSFTENHGGKYPPTNKWCDLLVDDGEVKEKYFTCPAIKVGRCYYAMNPNAEPNGPSDLVLLFETKAGWNQFGGPELLTLENHRGKGCNVLFSDGHVKFVKAEEIGKLKWE